MESEEAQKIFEIVAHDKTLAYAVAGFVTMGKFNLREELQRKMKWVAKREFDSCKKYLTAVAERITDEINEAKNANLIETLPAYRRTETGQGWKIADLVLVGYFKGIPSFTYARLANRQQHAELRLACTPC